MKYIVFFLFSFFGFLFVLHQACVFRDHKIFKQDFIGIGEGK